MNFGETVFSNNFYASHY